MKSAPFSFRQISLPHHLRSINSFHKITPITQRQYWIDFQPELLMNATHLVRYANLFMIREKSQEIYNEIRRSKNFSRSPRVVDNVRSVMIYLFNN